MIIVFLSQRVIHLISWARALRNMAWFWVNLKQALASSKGSCKLLRFCDINSIHRASTLCIKEELAVAYSWSRLCAFSSILILSGIKILENTVGKSVQKVSCYLWKWTGNYLKQAFLVVSLNWLNCQKL